MPRPHPMFTHGFFFKTSIYSRVLVCLIHIVFYPDILRLTEHGGDRGYAGGIWHHFFDRFSPR